MTPRWTINLRQQPSNSEKPVSFCFGWLAEMIPLLVMMNDFGGQVDFRCKQNGTENGRYWMGNPLGMHGVIDCMLIEQIG